MHHMHVAVAPSPAPSVRGNGRHTLHFLRESFCAKPKTGHVCRRASNQNPAGCVVCTLYPRVDLHGVRQDLFLKGDAQLTPEAA